MRKDQKRLFKQALVSADMYCIESGFKGIWQWGQFPRFCINWFGIGPLHYISSHSDFGFEFAEIFVIEKRLADSTSRGVADSQNRQVGESPKFRTVEGAKNARCRERRESRKPRTPVGRRPSVLNFFKLQIHLFFWCFLKRYLISGQCLWRATFSLLPFHQFHTMQLLQDG